MKVNKRRAEALIVLTFIISSIIITPILISLDSNTFYNLNFNQNQNHDTMEENLKKDPPPIPTSSNSPPNAHYFNFYKNITIDSEKVSGSNDLVDFPLLVSILDSDLRVQVQSNGNDIAFSNGTEWLDHEIELFEQDYNPRYAKLAAWVRIPLLSGSEDTVIYMYYGNSTMTSRQNPTDVWDSSYVGVWHLNQDPTGTIYDSTSNDNDGSAFGSMSSVDLVSGKIGGALDFDGENDYINVGNFDVVAGGSSNDGITMQAWYYAHDWDYDSRIISKATDSSESTHYWMMGEASNEHRMRLKTSGTTTTHFSGATTLTGSWHHYIVSYDGNYIKFYEDGSQKGSSHSKSGTISTSSSVSVAIGANPDEYGPFDGLLDEIRISNIARSIDWITTEYYNLNDPESFYSISGRKHVTRPNPEDFNYFKTITIDHTKVAGLNDLTDFPMLVSIIEKDLHDEVQSDGGDDIAFWNGSEWLDHEIELFNKNYNSTHSQLIAWVRIPSLSPSIDTKIYIYYGNSTLCSQETPEGVWLSNYAGVWHLNELSGGANSIKESTANVNIGTDYYDPIFDNDGRIYKSVEFDDPDVDSDYQRIEIADDNSLDISDQLTVEAWINPNSVSEWMSIVTKMDGDWGIGMTSNEDLYSAIDSSGEFFVGLANSFAEYEWYSNVYISPQTWQHIVFTYDSSTSLCTVYKNGEYGNSQNFGLGSLNTNSNPLYIGFNRGWLNEMFDGFIDEVRISNVSRSPDWIATEYINQNDPSSFYSVGNEFRAGLADVQVNAFDLYGYPIPNTNISMHNTEGILQSALTDIDGSASFPDTLLDEYNFTATIQSNIPPFYIETVNFTTEAISINHGFNNITLVCNVSRNVFRLTDIDGKPLESGWIIVNNSTMDLQNCTIDSSGQTIFWWKNSTGYQYTVWYRNDIYNPSAIILASGEINSPNIPIELQVNLTTVEYTIFTVDGSETIGGARLMFHNTTSSKSVANFTTDFDGKVIFRWLNTSSFYNYSLRIKFYGEFKAFNITGVGEADPVLEFPIISNASYIVYLEISSSVLQQYETSIISLNPSDNIQIEWGSYLMLRALFNVTKVPSGSPISTGPENANSMWYEIYDDDSVFIKSDIMSIEIDNIGRYQCIINTQGLGCTDPYKPYDIRIKAFKSEYRLPQDIILDLHILKNELILNQSENDDSIQTVHWQELANMSVKTYGKISEDLIIEENIYQSTDHIFQFSIPDLSTDWNLSQITFNIYNIQWNVADESYINITILGPYGEFLKVSKKNATDVGSSYDFSVGKEGWWIGIPFELNKESPFSNNTFNFIIGGTFDSTVDIVAEASFVRDKVNVEYKKFNITTDTIALLSDGNGWVITNITIDIYNCYNTTDWSQINDVSTVISKISPYEGQNYTLITSGIGTARVIIDNITIYPINDQFLFRVFKEQTNIVFNVNITVEYVQKFYQNHYTEELNLTLTMSNYDKTVNTFQVTVEQDWNDDSIILIIDEITDGNRLFFPSELNMNITVNGQTYYSITDKDKGRGIFSLESIVDFNKDAIYSAQIGVNQLINFSIYYIVSYSKIVIYELEATVTYKIEGTVINEMVQYDEHLGYYLQAINASLLYSRILPFTIEFTGIKDQYESQTKELDILIIERITLINDYSTNPLLYPEIYVQDAINYTFSYIDYSLGTNIMNLDIQSYYIARIVGSQNIPYSSGNLYVNTNNEYILDVNTETLPVGKYGISVTLYKQNYESKGVTITLIVNKREIDYDLGELFEDKQTSVIKGKTITFSIELTDPTQNDIPLTGAKVILEIGDDELEFEEVESGVYELEFETDEYEAFFISNTLTATIKVTKENYTSEDIDITIVIEIEEIFDGIPTFYFLIFISAIAIVVGSLATYRYIQIAKIPKFVKKTRLMKKSIKAGNKLPDLLLTTSKELSILKQFENEWEEVGISLGEVLRIKPKKDDVTSNVEGGAK